MHNPEVRFAVDVIARPEGQVQSPKRIDLKATFPYYTVSLNARSGRGAAW